MTAQELLRPYQWMDDAKCVGLGAHWDLLDMQNQLKVCDQCPVKSECTEYMGLPRVNRNGTVTLGVGSTCKNGHHIRTIDDLYFKPGGGRRCNICQVAVRRRHYLREATK